jgi:hypothetical protein
MHREFSRDLSDATIVRLFLPFAYAEMKALLSLGRHLLRPQLLIHGVAKSIACGLGAVGPPVEAVNSSNASYPKRNTRSIVCDALKVGRKGVFV